MKKLYFLVALLSLWMIRPAQAELQIDVTGGVSNPMPIAFPQMIAESGAAQSYGEQIREVIIADLAR